MTPLLAQPLNRPAIPVSLRRITVDEYHRMIEDGYFADNERFELINGLILEKMPKNPPHATAVTAVRQLLEAQLSRNGFVVRVQDPITLADSEPEPDVVVARGSLSAYAKRHPGPQDVPLLAEIADSTVALDQGMKLDVYAAAGLPLYLLVNIPAGEIELYRLRAPGEYGPPARFKGNDVIELQVDGECLRLTASDILGPYGDM